MPDTLLRAAEAHSNKEAPLPEEVQAWVLSKARERQEGDLGRVGEARRYRWTFYLFEGRNKNIFLWFIKMEWKGGKQERSQKIHRRWLGGQSVTGEEFS